MSDHQPAETDDEPDRDLIRQGREFEREYTLDATAVGVFLAELGEQLQSDDEVTLQTDEWELPFEFGEPVELEIDFEGAGQPELEIEVEIPGKTTDDAPDVR